MSRAPLPAIAVPGAVAALLALDRAVSDSGLAPLTRELVHIRASQLNGCGVCLVQHPPHRESASTAAHAADGSHWSSPPITGAGIILE